MPHKSGQPICQLEATEWGYSHEKLARDLYKKTNGVEHQDFTAMENGFFINSEWPFIGASPDGIVECSCHGKGTFEIKCPYCHRGEDIVCATSNDKKFCLKKDVDGALFLDPDHAYYYQIQTQLLVCDVSYSDFCVAIYLLTQVLSQPCMLSVFTEILVSGANLWSMKVVFLGCVSSLSLWVAGLLAL